MRHRARWALVKLGCIGLFVLRTRLNRAFRSVFRFISDDISDNFCVVCTHTAFFIKKQRAYRDFQVNSPDNFCVVCTSPKHDNIPCIMSIRICVSYCIVTVPQNIKSKGHSATCPHVSYMWPSVAPKCYQARVTGTAVFARCASLHRWPLPQGLLLPSPPNRCHLG